jgi:hypothetical protein
MRTFLMRTNLTLLPGLLHHGFPPTQVPLLIKVTPFLRLGNLWQAGTFATWCAW